MNDDMLALAARVEALAEPDKATFWQAFSLAYSRPARIWEDENREEWTADYSNWQGRQQKFADYLDVGAWLDAAMTLVPEITRMRGLGEGKSGVWTADLASRDNHRCIAVGSGRTPALALCAASLRARASMGGE